MKKEFNVDELNKLKPFEQLLATHPARNHPLFDYLSWRGADFTAAEYSSLAINFIGRTLFTIPEVFATGVEAAKDLRLKGIAYAAMTAAEEGGSGRPDQVHSALMIGSINHHGIAVYGEEFTPVDAKKLMAFLTMNYYTAQVLAFANLGPKEQGKDITKDNERNHALGVIGIISLSDLSENIYGIAESLGLKVNIARKKDRPKTIEDFITCMAISQGHLVKMGVNPETVAYAFEQFVAMRSQKKGYLQGVAFAHEGLADDMMDKMFTIKYAQIGRYKNRRDFHTHTYPYYAAHGDYIARAENREARGGEDIEAEHARRERVKLLELEPSGLNNALEGARDFADRQERVWSDLLRSLIEAKDKVPARKQQYGRWSGMTRVFTDRASPLR